jgi:undecaprenyl-diphosphatase
MASLRGHKCPMLFKYMELQEILILAVVQGVTEFLPVSSSGHLFLARQWLGLSDEAGAAWDVLLHVGTLVAVVGYYRRQWWRLLRSLWRPEEREQQRLLGQLVLATIPAAVAGILAQAAVEGWLRTEKGVAVGLMVTGGVLLLQNWCLGMKAKEGLSWGQALWIGLAQAVALWPGVSRSGITIAAGRQVGLKREAAVEVSFLMAGPIIAGAGLVKVPALWQEGAAEWPSLLLGLGVAAAVGWVAIWFIEKLVRRYALWPFGVYVLGLAAVMWYVA